MSGCPHPVKVGATCIHYMDLNISSSFISVKNIGNRGRAWGSFAMEWIYKKKVGVMIASNLGRPGGACCQETHRGKFEFHSHPDIKTQEESVLTFIHRIVLQRGGGRSSTNFLETQLNWMTQMFGMDTPRGDQGDFIAYDKLKRHSFNVRSSCDPDDYDREIGSEIDVVDASNKNQINKIYISFIAGPNACPPSDGVWNARLAKSTNRLKGFDTMFRTISTPAINSYRVFRDMIITALVSSLHKMLSLGYEYAIMASPSSGIYAGHHQERIQKEYNIVCIEALEQAYTMLPQRFREVIVPTYYKPAVRSYC